MPNNGRIAVCPYYRDEKNLSISCEDTYRRFRWPVQKSRWMDAYCDKGWEGCPFAQALNRLYERMGEGSMDGRELEMEHRLKASEREKRKLSSLLGKAEKREKEKDAEIRKLRKRNRALEAFYVKNRAAMDGIRELKERMRAELELLAEIYEGRIAYLMANFAGGRLDEAAMKTWLAEFEYRIEMECIADGLQGESVACVWSVRTKAKDKEDGNESCGADRAADKET